MILETFFSGHDLLTSIYFHLLLPKAEKRKAHWQNMENLFIAVFPSRLSRTRFTWETRFVNDRKVKCEAVNVKPINFLLSREIYLARPPQFFK